MDDSITLIRNRIMAVATRRFAERKYTPVNMSDIYRDLKVDRSVVKQHFSTKEDLLAAILDSFLQDIEDILLTFIDGFLLSAVNSGTLEIRDDRIHCENPQSAAVFSRQVVNHLEAVFDYLFVHSNKFILLIQESFVPGAHTGDLDRLLRLFLPIAENPLLVRNKAVSKIHLTPEAQAGFMQTSVIPILGYTLVKEHLDPIASQCVETYKNHALDDIRANLARHTKGSDIIFMNKQ